MKVKVIVHDGVVIGVLSTEEAEVEIVDIDKDYEDYEALKEYEQKLYDDPSLHEQDYTVARFDEKEEQS